MLVRVLCCPCRVVCRVGFSFAVFQRTLYWSFPWRPWVRRQRPSGHPDAEHPGSVMVAQFLPIQFPPVRGHSLQVVVVIDCMRASGHTFFCVRASGRSRFGHNAQPHFQGPWYSYVRDSTEEPRPRTDASFMDPALDTHTHGFYFLELRCGDPQNNQD